MDLFCTNDYSTHASQPTEWFWKVTNCVGLQRYIWGVYTCVMEQRWIENASLTSLIIECIVFVFHCHWYSLFLFFLSDQSSFSLSLWMQRKRKQRRRWMQRKMEERECSKCWTWKSWSSRVFEANGQNSQWKSKTHNHHQTSNHHPCWIFNLKAVFAFITETSHHSFNPFTSSSESCLSSSQKKRKTTSSLQDAESSSHRTVFYFLLRISSHIL